MKSELKPRTLMSLRDAYVAKELRVNPDYQRGLQWGSSQKQGLIDSLLRGYQIPIFYIHLESRTNNYTQATETTAWIVDGQQRIDKGLLPKRVFASGSQKGSAWHDRAS